MAINSNSNRGKKTYSFYRQRPVATSEFDDANRMAKTYGSIRRPDLEASSTSSETPSNAILTEASEFLMTESGEYLVTES